MTKTLHTLLLIWLLAPAISHAQYRDENRVARLASHSMNAAGDVFSWYDAPVFFFYFANRYEALQSAGKPVMINASGLEHEVAEGLGVSGSESFGSIDPFALPHAILGARTVQILAIELLTEDGNAEEEMRHAFGLYRSVMYTQVATQTVKSLVHRVRPDGSDDKSFFSGHTSVAFATCSWLQMELDDAIMSSDALKESPFLRNALRAAAASATYGWAGYVGYSRIRDNKHYLGDVLTGAAVGMLISHLTYSAIHNGGPTFLDSFGVGVTDGQPAVSFVYSF